MPPRNKLSACSHLCVMVATATAFTGGGGGSGDFICFGVVLRSYSFVIGDGKWNWAHTAINDAGLHLRKEDFLSKGVKTRVYDA